MIWDSSTGLCPYPHYAVGGYFLFTIENFEDVVELAQLKMLDPYNLLSWRPA